MKKAIILIIVGTIIILLLELLCLLFIKDKELKPISWELNDFNESNINKNIYFYRSDKIYKFNKKTNKIEYLSDMPKENTKIISFIVDNEEKYLYYTYRPDKYTEEYIFKKLDLITKEETVIKEDTGFSSAVFYDDLMIYYSLGTKTIGIYTYNTSTNQFKEIINRRRLNGNGRIKIDTGKIYYYSTMLYQISLGGSIKEVGSTDYFSFNGYLFNNKYYYLSFSDKGYLKEKTLGLNEEKILDSFELSEFVTDYVEFDGIIVQGNKVYYSYDDRSTYVINTDGTNKKKIADTTINGDIFINDNKIYIYTIKDGLFWDTTSSLRDEFYLKSIDITTGKVQQYDFE